MSTLLAMLGVFAISAGSYRMAELSATDGSPMWSLVAIVSGGLLVGWALEDARAGR